MQDIEKNPRQSQHKLLLTILFIFLLIVVAYTTFWEIRYYTKYNHFQKVEAQVVSHVEKDGKTYDELRYFVDGIEYYKETSYESKNEIDDTVIVYYDVDSPIGIIYSLDYRRYAYPIISIMLCAVWVSFFIMYKISYPKSKTKIHKKEKLQ